MFTLYRGKTKVMYFKKSDTAREVRNGGLVCINDSGSVAPPKNDSTDRIVGVCRVNDTVTDTAFGLNDITMGSIQNPGMVPVEVPVENAVEWMIDTDSDAGAADTDRGRYCAVDTTGGGSVSAGDSAGTRIDISDTAIRSIYITGIVSASKVTGIIARTAFPLTLGQDTTGA